MSLPALLGGNPVRVAPFPSWPPVTESAIEAVSAVARDGVWSFVGGDRKTEFETAFASYHHARHGLAVSNGSVALEIALTSLGVGSGDEVIVPGYTFLASATAILRINALPIFVDVDPATACLDPNAVAAAITPRTKAIIAVHFAGHPADMDALTALASQHDVALIEDCAHAHGAAFNGQRVGSFGAFGAWSFQASKNMTAGEGGALTSNDQELIDTAWSFHNCGRARSGQWYDHRLLGSNHRMTEFQAALLLDQLKNLDVHIARRERSAELLDSELAKIDGLTPLGRTEQATTHAYHLYQFFYDAEQFGGLPRARFLEAMQAEGIGVSGGYGKPLDRQAVFADHNFDVRATGFDPDYAPTNFGGLDLPVTQRFCDDIVWITQSVLLAEDADIADIATAAAKIRDHTDVLAA